MSDETRRSRAALARLRAETTQHLESTGSVLEKLRREREGANDDDEHDPDGVTLSSEWSRLTGLANAARAKLAQIDHALARLDAGTYGLCARCGRSIPAARLEIRPFAEHCVPCAEKLAR